MTARRAGVRTRPRVAFCCLPLRFLQLLADLFFFVANVIQMTLEKWKLGCLRVWVVALLLTNPVLWSRLLRLTNPLQQGVFFSLKRGVAVLQRLNAICSRLLFG